MSLMSALTQIATNLHQLDRLVRDRATKEELGKLASEIATIKAKLADLRTLRQANHQTVTTLN